MDRGSTTMKSRRSLPSGEGRFTTRDRLSLWYKISGHGPVLLVPTPGWGASADMYMKSLVPLERDFTLIYLDTRGAGRSDAPAKNSGYAFSFFIDDFETLRVHLRLNRWWLFAHSDASLQAMAYAIEYPKACRGLFIVDGTLNINDKAYRDDQAAASKKISHQHWYAAAIKATNKASKSDEDFKKSFLGAAFPLYFANYKAAVKARHYFSASTYHVKKNKYDENTPAFVPEKLAQVRVPTAVFVGDSDVITTPVEAARLHRGISNSTLFIITNAGHFPWLEQPKMFFKDFAQAARKLLEHR
jgi:proline iminopeptidase